MFSTSNKDSEQNLETNVKPVVDEESPEKGDEEKSFSNEEDDNFEDPSQTLYLTVDEDDEEEGDAVGDNVLDQPTTLLESSDDEIQEPKLKYERLSSDLRAILEKDSVSCISIHFKVLLLGSHWGKVHMLDAMGNSMMEFSGHSGPINQISIDHAGEYAASCSSDGKVTIRNLLGNLQDDQVTVDLKTTGILRSISIDPLYGKPTYGKRFMTGDDNVVLHEKILFNRYKQKVLSRNEGPISLIKWRGRFAAWSNRHGIKVYDVIEEKIISIIKYDNVDDNTPTRISWSNQFNLIVAIGDTVNVCAVKKRTESRSGELPEYFVEIKSSFTISDSWVCGIAPYENQLALLLLPKKQESDGDSQKPLLQIVEPLKDDYDVICSDLLSIGGYEKYGPKDYHLEYLVDYQQLFIISPKDIFIGKPRDFDDRIDWLLDSGKFKEALDLAETNKTELRKHKVLDVGKKYLDFLLEDAQFHQAGKLCVKIFGKEKKLWQKEVIRFAKLNQLKVIAPFLPVYNPVLDSQIYERVLLELLRNDADGFLDTIKKWPSTIYSSQAIVNPLVEKLLVNPENECLQRSLATLFSNQGKYDKAMAILLKLGHEDVFDVIRNHNLIDSLDDKILDLMVLNHTKAIKLFFDNIKKLTPDYIVTRLEGSGKQLYIYLDNLSNQFFDESRKFHPKLVLLYADFDRTKLLPFLKLSESYPIKEALKICKNHHYTDEQIYLLTRIGNPKAALNLITDTLCDIHKAIEFCKEIDEQSIWHDLIDKSIDKPFFINVLLHNIGTHVDPRILIQKIETDQEIPGLRDSLVQIIQDYRIQVNLNEGCQKAIAFDCSELIQSQVSMLNRGISIHEDRKCLKCDLNLIDSKELIVFKCNHVYHNQCLNDSKLCPVCDEKRIFQRY